uniref:glycoside hydrolase family 25 protein n=2 Tax=Alloprevotella sp. TaxID=1872471 RepID=UPI003FD6CA0A
MKNQLFKIGTYALAFAMLATIPATAMARKKDKNQGRGMAAYVATEPDVLASKAVGEKRMIHAAAVFMRSSNARINSKYKEGIDVSHYQGRIDWDAVVNGTPISYVYLKATEGASLVDDTYERNLEEARRVGLSVGSYHFYRPNVDWKKQFDNMTAVVKYDDQDLVPIIDIEHRGSVSDEAFITDLRSFIERVTEFYGKKPLLYTYHNFYNRYLQGEFKDYHFMIARYRSDSPTLNDGKDYIMWQYTSTGSIPGIRGHVDRSKIMGNFSLNQVMM